MILWTVLPLDQVMAGYDNQIYPEYETDQIAGIPVLMEKVGEGKKKVVRIISSNPDHYLNRSVYPGLVI